ncbi:predicted protein [Plenodomus lingam JN3]|uniref:Predicted protein n=1 Tax=Leptosphaeria maculans (strain JN3 / isolate v23.1.3 / race Av1-4-5-6-7-8) TaxID=985895 RepID=E4ZTP0_LEPMJ|nr:predicted protein [Plenodomus lingam JN3]CBX94896.1 predicted protein [Plenodomus lingam JN3]
MIHTAHTPSDHYGITKPARLCTFSVVLAERQHAMNASFHFRSDTWGTYSIIIGRRYIGDEQNASGDSKAHGRTIGKEAQASPR